MSLVLEGFPDEITVQELESLELRGIQDVVGLNYGLGFRI